MGVCTLHIADSDEPDISVWETEEAAAKQACFLMCQVIDNEWDLSDEEQDNHAKEISRLIKGGNYLAAVNYWNDCDIVMNSCYYNTYWIESHDVHKLSDVEEPLVYNYDDDEIPPVLAPKASHFHSAGATCRQCHTRNEYASADKADGTYLCRGCKGMSQIFGN